MAVVKRFLPSVTALVLLGLLAAPGVASAQSSPVPADEAQEFLGQWSLEIDGGQGEVYTLIIDIQDQDGNVAAELSSDQMPQAATVNEIERTESSLILTFMVQAQGQMIPVEIELTPEGENMNALVEAADGMFFAEGVASPV